jgi:hypothetical protein
MKYSERVWEAIDNYIPNNTIIKPKPSSNKKNWRSKFDNYCIFKFTIFKLRINHKNGLVRIYAFFVCCNSCLLRQFFM